LASFSSSKGRLLSARDTLASSFGSIEIFKTIWWHRHPGTNIFFWHAYNHLLLVAFHTPGYQHSSRKVQTFFGDKLQTTIWTVQILFTALSLFQIRKPSGFKFYNVAPKFRNEKLHTQDRNKQKIFTLPA
jgi:hypothetical protein